MVKATIGRNILRNLLSLLFPSRCVHCGREGESLCPACGALLEPLGEGNCRRCGGGEEGGSCPECERRELHFRLARSRFAYRGPARSLVHALKYGNQRHLAAAMSRLTRGHGDSNGFFQGATLVPVPMHCSREYERGYNQAALYARALAGLYGASYAELLLRVRQTDPQNSLDFRRRLENPRHSIAPAAGRPHPGGRVVLVDDVYTTGSTASECARVIRRELGVQVDVWTFARTVKRWSKGSHFPMGK